MKKKLLSTLAAVSMLSNLVTPVLAAPPSHHTTDTQTHYSFATGYEGKVTEAEFSKTSYSMQNGNKEDFLEELMAFVDDSLLAHELNYVEWFIENHDSNYPFSLASSTLGEVYCGFDSGTATLTAVITRDDGAIVKASTTLVAQPRTLQYASGFTLSASADGVFFTGEEAINAGDGKAEVTITPTPDNSCFSEAQFNAIKRAIEVDRDLDISLRSGNNIDFDDGYVIEANTSDLVFSVDKEDPEEFWNGYSGMKEIVVSYPIGDGLNNNESYSSTADYGKLYLQIKTDGGYANSNATADYDIPVGGIDIKSGTATTDYNFGSSDTYLPDLLACMNASSKYTVKNVSPDWVLGYGSSSPVVLEFTLQKDSDTWENILADLEDVYGSDNVSIPRDYGYYTFNATGSRNNGGDYLEALLTNNFAGVDGTSIGVAVKSSNTTLSVTSGLTTAAEFVEFLNGENNYNTAFEIFDTTQGSGGKLADFALICYDTSANVTADNGIIAMNVYNGDVVYIEADAAAPPSDSDYDSNYVTLTYNGSKSKAWDLPSNYENYTPSTDNSGHGLRGFIANNGTSAYNYELSVEDFPRYLGTVLADTLDDVSRSVRISSAKAVQPDSLHQTSSITVAVGETINLTNHFKVTSTSNVNHTIEYNEAYFNNDSSYAYNDYGVILDGDEEILGVREGKNKVVASVWNSYDGKTHTAEVIVTVVPRTGVTTTVTPTSKPLAVTPTSHTTTLGGAGVQLSPSYFGESTFDVNDNTLPTLQSSSNGKVEDIVAYKSNDPTILSVNEDGFVTPVGVGTGTVTVYIPSSDYEATFTMTVIAPTIPQEDNSTGSTGSTPVPNTGVNALGQLF